MEDRELVALVFEEEVQRIHGPELEAVRARGLVDRRDVALGDAVAEGATSPHASFGASARACAASASRTVAGNHQTDRSISASGSWASQKPADRYFQPPSASTQTTTPSSSSPARRSAAWTTAPEETPPKMPSRSRSSRRPASDFARPKPDVMEYLLMTAPVTRYDALVARLRNAGQPNREAPADFAPYLAKVRQCAFQVAEEDIESLTNAGYSEDVIFEQTVSVAVAAGLERLAAGLAVLP